MFAPNQHSRHSDATPLDIDPVLGEYCALELLFAAHCSSGLTAPAAAPAGVLSELPPLSFTGALRSEWGMPSMAPSDVGSASPCALDWTSSARPRPAAVASRAGKASTRQFNSRILGLCASSGLTPGRSPVSLACPACLLVREICRSRPLFRRVKHGPHTRQGPSRRSLKCFVIRDKAPGQLMWRYVASYLPLAMRMQTPNLLFCFVRVTSASAQRLTCAWWRAARANTHSFCELVECSSPTSASRACESQ